MTLQCHASHDATMDLTFTWSLNGVLLDLENSVGLYHRVERVSSVRCGGQLELEGWYRPSSSSMSESFLGQGSECESVNVS